MYNISLCKNVNEKRLYMDYNIKYGSYLEKNYGKNRSFFAHKYLLMTCSSKSVRHITINRLTYEIYYGDQS